MARCRICNQCDTVGGGSTDLSDHMPYNNPVSYRKDLDEELCNYCYSQCRKNKSFYEIHFSQTDKLTYKEQHTLIIQGAVEAFKKRREYDRLKQENKEKPPAVPSL